MYEYRASELGACQRRLVLQRQGYEQMPPPANFAEIFAEGNRWEEIVIEHMRSRGFHIGHHPSLDVDQGQSFVRIRILDDVYVTGHLDGCIWDDTSWLTEGVKGRVLEIKSMAHDQFEDFVEKGIHRGDTLMEKYKWQVSPYMIAADMELMLVGVDKTSPPDDPHYHAVYLEEPPYSLGKIMQRVLRLELMAMDTPPDCDVHNYPCPVYYMGCTDQQLDANEIVSQLIVDRKIISDRMSQDKTALGKINESLAAELGDQKNIKVEEGTVYWNSGRTTKFFDEEAMVKDGVDVEKYRREKKGDKFVQVRYRKDKDEAAE